MIVLPVNQFKLSCQVIHMTAVWKSWANVGSTQLRLLRPAPQHSSKSFHPLKKWKFDVAIALLHSPTACFAPNINLLFSACRAGSRYKAFAQESAVGRGCSSIHPLANQTHTSIHPLYRDIGAFVPKGCKVNQSEKFHRPST